MILIDGAKFILQAPAKEKDLEDAIRDHSKDIWGPDSHYFEKGLLRSPAGVGSIPDGYVVTFGNSPRWYVVEVELSSHSLYDHIVPQVSKFAAGVANPNNRQAIIDAMWHAVDSDEELKAWVRNRTAHLEVHKYFSDLIAQPPALVVIFEDYHPQWAEVRDQFGQNFESVKDMVFKTLVREGCPPTIHAHVFEPIWSFAETGPSGGSVPFKTAVEGEQAREFERLPLRLAWPFLQTKGLGNESAKIEKSRDPNNAKRARIVGLLMKNSIMDEFVDKCWPLAKTEEGKKRLGGYKATYSKLTAAG